MKYNKRQVERIANLVEVIDNVGFGHSDFDYNKGISIMHDAASAIDGGIGAVMFGEEHYSGALTIWVLCDDHISAFLYDAENGKITVWIDGFANSDDSDVMYEMNEADITYDYNTCDTAHYLIDLFNTWEKKFL